MTGQYCLRQKLKTHDTKNNHQPLLKKKNRFSFKKKRKREREILGVTWCVKLNVTKNQVQGVFQEQMPKLQSKSHREDGNVRVGYGMKGEKKEKTCL